MIRRPAVALAFLLAACGTTGAQGPGSLPPSTPVPTVPGVGRLPDTVPPPRDRAETGSAAEPPVSITIGRPVGADGAVLDTVAEQVNGNRLLVIGDSILASTATRYGREMCDALNPLGWTVEVDAEPGRFVEFGNKVLISRLPDDVSDEDDFDAAIVHLGSNYNLDRQNYFDQLNEVLYRIAPRPTLLMTVTEYRPAWAEVNDVIEELAALYDNVTVVDWEKVARTPGVLSRDGLHPGNQGEQVMIELLSVALGEVGDVDGECLRSAFTDDSSVGQGSGPNGGSSTGGTSTGGGSGSSSSSSSGGSSTGGSSSGGSSSGGTSSGGSSSGGTGTTGTTGTGTTGGTTDTTGGTGTTGADTTGGTTDTTGGTGVGTTGGVTDTTGGTTGGTTDSTGGTTGGSTDSTGGGSTSSTTGAGTTGGAADTTGGSTTGSSSGGSGGATTGTATTAPPVVDGG